MKTGKEFVEHYSNLFTGDKEWWAEQIDKLIYATQDTGGGDKHTHDFGVVYRKETDLVTAECIMRDGTGCEKVFHAGEIERIVNDYANSRTQDTGEREAFDFALAMIWGDKDGWNTACKKQEQRWWDKYLATGEMEVCVWTYDDDSDSWDGTCGVKWILSDGTPKEHDMKFCPRCGAVLKAKEGR